MKSDDNNVLIIIDQLPTTSQNKYLLYHTKHCELLYFHNCRNLRKNSHSKK